MSARPLLNPIVAAWLNGCDYSTRRFGHRPFRWLLGELSRATAQPVRSIRDAYEVSYQKTPVVAVKSALAPARTRFPRDGSHPFLRPCAELQDYVAASFTEQELLGFYVHGSLATDDYIEGSSDFDSLVVVRKEVVDDPAWAEDFRRRLARSNTFLFLLDPLQHHTHFVVTEYDLAHYFETLFPVVLFKYARELTSYGNVLTFACHDDSDQMREQLAARRFYFGQLWPSLRRRRAYDVKNAVQNVLLLPALYLQLKTKQYRYKRETFEAARQHFDARLWSIVERASRVRRECPFRTIYPYGVRRWIGLHLHYKWLHLLHRVADRDNAQKMTRVLGDSYLNDALQLTDAMERACGAFNGKPEPASS